MSVESCIIKMHSSISNNVNKGMNFVSVNKSTQSLNHIITYQL